MSVRVMCGDCRDVLAGLEAESFSAVVTDPPAGISFMNRAWDHDKGGRDAWIAWMQEIAAECLRVCKPGAHALVWALPRTSHWTAMAWENAGWTVRDRVSHLFGSGFPKSLDVSRAIDRAAGAEREVVGRYLHPGRSDDWSSYPSTTAAKPSNGRYGDFGVNSRDITAPATEAARQWQGWGTALKPAMEDWWLLRKPLSESTVAANCLKHGTGALNIEACRINPGDPVPGGGNGHANHGGRYGGGANYAGGRPIVEPHTNGRWPAQICHDGSPEVMQAFARFGERASGSREAGEHQPLGMYANAIGKRPDGMERDMPALQANTGTAARFFFSAKAAAWERVTSEIEDVALEFDEQLVELTVCVEQSPPRVIAASGAHAALLTEWNTFLFGNGTTDLCQTATSYTTSTKISSTTGLKTWNWLIRSLTRGCTAGASSEKTDGGSPAESAADSTMNLTITVDQTASLPGAARVMSETRLRISVSEGQSAGHPTVKPVALMEWLVKLVCHPSGRLLDPFCGTGSTLVACDWLGFDAVGIEQDAQTCRDAEAKIKRLRARRMLGDVPKAEPIPGQLGLF